MNEYLNEVKESSYKRYSELKSKIEAAYSGKKEFENACVFACGSMGRLDMTTGSDLDLFFIENNDEKNKISDLNKHLFFADLYKINDEMCFEKPSRNGAFWIFTQKQHLLDIGSQVEDFNNSFTARLLLLLESKPLFNDELYNKLIEETVNKYFYAYDDNQDCFLPLFMMNDILRYWYTLTLNYEFRRDSNDNPDKKYWKRLKLKFARLITCYSLYLCLYEPDISPEYTIDCIKMTPLERLESISQKIPQTLETVLEIEKEYEWYLELRKQGPEWWSENGNKEMAFERADKFHNLVTHELTTRVASFNKRLSEKTELNC